MFRDPGFGLHGARLGLAPLCSRPGFRLRQRAWLAHHCHCCHGPLSGTEGGTRDRVHLAVLCPGWVPGAVVGRLDLRGPRPIPPGLFDRHLLVRTGVCFGLGGRAEKGSPCSEPRIITLARSVRPALATSLCPLKVPPPTSSKPTLFHVSALP